ncbi:hypothetical protein Taro_045780 [Colocasia esculenta]|uniref:Uncharacterized protein n=1 Tax=Colocasia esculenta TaxID=4460 RepID=A0A843X6U1_COLES|nr:hypothetical protein [Colocasia esculenta]
MQWSLLTSGLERRRPSPPRSSRDGKVRRDSNRCSVFKKAGRTEVSQVLLDQGRSCCGRFGVPAWCSMRSRREDVTRSGGNAAPCLDCAFFVKFYPLRCALVLAWLLLWLVSGDSLIVVCLVGVCPRGGTVVFVFRGGSTQRKRVKGRTSLLSRRRDPPRYREVAAGEGDAFRTRRSAPP